jgi:muconolactone delta-isomerase
MGLTSTLFKLARLSADARAVRTPASAARRVKNKAVGRLLARGGIWRRLWR